MTERILMEVFISSWRHLICFVCTMIIIACSCAEKERALYIVIMEDDPLSFFEGSSQLNEGGRRSSFDPNSEMFKAHAKKLVESHDELLQNTLESGSYNKLYSFKHLVNAFAVHTIPSQAEKLRCAEGVMLVERDRGVKLMTTYTPQFLGLPKDRAHHNLLEQLGHDPPHHHHHNSYDLLGEGIVIGFVDSGINPTHTSFAFDPLQPSLESNDHNYASRFSGACEMGPNFPESSCNGKIISARFFSAGAQAFSTFNASLDFLSPFDSYGHGSHVASIAAGNAGVPVVVNGFYYGRASGIAPRARIAVYKATYNSASSMSDVYSAIEQAAIDGVDILSISVGPPEPEKDTFTFFNAFDIYLQRARRAGIIVVQAAGNGGPGPSTISSYSPWAVGVASSTTDRFYPNSLLLGNGRKVGGFGLSAPTFGKGRLLHRLVLAKDAIKPNGTFPPYNMEECQYAEAFDREIVRGSILICTPSVGFYSNRSTFSAIVDTARKLELMGFVFVANPSYGNFEPDLFPTLVPSIMIPYVADAKVILRYYKKHTHRDKRGLATKFKAKAGIGEGRVASFGGKAAPRVSRYSSRGPDFIDSNRKIAADVLKPDILAPGHLVWGAWSPISTSQPYYQGSNFALMSGTSMATPHIAGVAALIKQKNPWLSPSMIASAMSTTATKYDRKNGQLIMAEGYYYGTFSPSTPFDTGAGLVNPARAIDPGLVFFSEYEDYARFACTIPDINTSYIRFCKKFPSLGHPANLNLPSITISKLVGSQQLHRRVKNVGRKIETYITSVVPPNGTSVSICPPWFTLSPEKTQHLIIQINVTKERNSWSFGEVVFTGTLNHIARMPLSVFPISMS